MLLIEESPVVSGVLIDGALCLLKHIPHELMKDLRTHALLSSASASTAPHCGESTSNAAQNMFFISCAFSGHW